MERVALTMQLLPGAEAGYRRRPADVWPEMLDELRAAGISNDTIDLLDCRAHMAASPVNERWQADIAGPIDPGTDPATGFHRRLDEVFRLA